jgi:23S rRNA (cytosine1962-C5)-methyltransferase
MVRVVQDGVVMYADPHGGQKTGLFLDQRDNRKFVRSWCREARVLDLFCHAGGWAFNAALGGAREVVGVDVSEPVIEMARKAAAELGFEQVKFECTDVFDYLKELGPEVHYDVIICDPPAFAKTKMQVNDAVKAYLTLNYRAMKLLAPGGILVSCSCSQSLGWIEFEQMLLTAARNARMQFQVVRRSPQPIDHAPLLGFPESEYLKVCFLQRIE